MTNNRIIPALCALFALLIGIFAVVLYKRSSNSLLQLYGQECYRITQYGNDNNSQMMFYTIESSDGRFAVIDGGWSWNEQAVREVIKKNGNHVDAWILTHPHPDHIGAFNAIMQDLGGITVDMVYDVYIDLSEYEEVAREWDEIDVYKDYLLMAFDGDFPVTHLNRGDVLDIIGLSVTVLNSYDDEVRNRTQSYCNCGSLMLSMKAAQETFLVCADVEEDMADYLIETYGDDAGGLLSADYVQMSHHGNWGLNVQFYDNVHAKAAFFDGYEELYEESGLYNGYEFMTYMQQNAQEVYTFKTTPNSVILY